MLQRAFLKAGVCRGGGDEKKAETQILLTCNQKHK
jgi:hypothetical protein